MQEDKLNEVEVKVLPTWKVLFSDDNRNVITDTEVIDKLKITDKFGDVNIRLCVNYYKLIDVCPAANGNDNVNKGYYFICGDKYFLNATEITYRRLDYPIKLIGGDKDCSSEDRDF